MAVNPTLPPTNYFATDNKTLIGFEADLWRDIATELGLKYEFVETGFPTMIPGLQSGRYQVALNGISDTAAREKVVQFVDYLDDGLGLLIAGGNPKHINGVEDMCGNIAAVATGTIAVTVMKDQSKKCVAAGKPPVEVDIFPTNAQVTLQLQTGRADATLHAYTNALYEASTSNGKYDVAPSHPFNPYSNGIALPLNSPLAKPIQAAINDLMKNGTYINILTKYGVQDLAAKEATIDNACTSC